LLRLTGLGEAFGLGFDEGFALGAECFRIS
jgi:hypothetical protein